MNKTNVQHAINIMKRAGNINMGSWQQVYSGDKFIGIKDDEEDLHTCGTGACFAGWVAVSPEFKEAGGYPNPRSGTPVIEDPDDVAICDGADAIGYWLDIDLDVAEALCAVQDEGEKDLYPKGDVTKEDIIDSLTKLLNGTLNYE